MHFRLLTVLTFLTAITLLVAIAIIVRLSNYPIVFTASKQQKATHSVQSLSYKPSDDYGKLVDSTSLSSPSNLEDDFRRKFLLALPDYSRNARIALSRVEQKQENQPTKSAVLDTDSPLETDKSNKEEPRSLLGRPSQGGIEDRERLESRLASETPDPSWTRETQDYLAELIRDGEIGAKVEQVTCTTTICRSQIIFDNFSSAKELGAIAGDSAGDVTFYPTGYRGKLRLIIFSARPGEHLDGITKG
jgi:hypothetical protein